MDTWENQAVSWNLVERRGCCGDPCGYGDCGRSWTNRK